MLSALGDFELNWHGSVFHASGCETRRAFRMVSGVYTTAIHAVGCLLLYMYKSLNRYTCILYFHDQPTRISRALRSTAEED